MRSLRPAAHQSPINRLKVHIAGDALPDAGCASCYDRVLLLLRVLLPWIVQSWSSSEHHPPQRRRICTAGDDRPVPDLGRSAGHDQMGSAGHCTGDAGGRSVRYFGLSTTGDRGAGDCLNLHCWIQINSVTDHCFICRALRRTSDYYQCEGASEFQPLSTTLKGAP